MFAIVLRLPALSGTILKCFLVIKASQAAMAELADAHGSGPCNSDIVEVRVLLAALYLLLKLQTIFLEFFTCLILPKKVIEGRINYRF
jgi:hypothetical protein